MTPQDTELDLLRRQLRQLQGWIRDLERENAGLRRWVGEVEQKVRETGSGRPHASA